MAEPVSEPPADQDDAGDLNEVSVAADGKVQWPRPLTTPERALRAGTFWFRVLPVLGAYKLLQTQVGLRKLLFDEELSEDEQQSLKDEVDEWGSDRLSETIKQLKGFYVKTGQVISTRVDLFPPPYTDKLQVLQDGLEPMDFELVKSVIEYDLMKGAGTIDELFSEFDPVPLGAASIAQVHRAVLLDGREVAVKVQRPNVEPKLRGDVGNLKLFAKRLAHVLPVDYYTVFCELEAALDKELDFLHEAQATEKVAAGIAHKVDGTPAEPPLYVPLPIPGLASRRVLVMEYVDGVPLSRVGKEMEKRGIGADSAERKVFGIRLLRALTEAYARMTFGTGFLHGDPHPGNLFVMKDGGVALIDCGQVKQLSYQSRQDLGMLVLTVSKYDLSQPVDSPNNKRVCASLATQMKEVGVTFIKDSRSGEDAAAAAAALMLFGSTEMDDLPGGYKADELSADSPLRSIESFPSDFVMLGRATVLIKGIAARLGKPWNLAVEWADAAKMVVDCAGDECRLPVYATQLPTSVMESQHGLTARPRFTDVTSAYSGAFKTTRKYVVGKVVGLVPQPIKSVVRRWGARILVWRDSD